MTPEEKEEQELLKVVADIKAEREEKRQIPTFSLTLWIIPRLAPENRPKLAETARRLEIQGRLKIGQTLNSTYMELIEAPEPPQQADLFQDQNND